MEDDALKTKILVCDPVHEEGIEEIKASWF